MMSNLSLLTDLLLMLALISTAGASLLSRDLFRAVVLFIVFGLLMSLTWIRLQAPDVAMAEAAIGAGLAGVLLLKTLVLCDKESDASSAPLMLGGLLSLALLAALALAVLSIPIPLSPLGEVLETALPDSGVSNPVTAVLLNFRGYDTFLELAVLTIAALVSLALQAAWAEPAPVPTRNGLLTALVVWLLPITILVAVYLFWAGSKEPGGAFQAGALLAAAGVLLRLCGLSGRTPQSGTGLHLALSMGLVAFLLVGLLGPVTGRELFSYPTAYAGTILVGLEAVLALSIACILLSLFSASPPSPEPGRER